LGFGEKTKESSGSVESRGRNSCSKQSTCTVCTLPNLKNTGTVVGAHSSESYVGTTVPGSGRPAEADLPSIVCNLSDDLLWGGEAIAAFVSEIQGRVVPPKRIYAWTDNGLLPVGHWGGRLVGSKNAIAAHFATIASAPSASTRSSKPTERYSQRPQPVRRGRQGRRVAKRRVGQDAPHIANPVPVGSDANLTVYADNPPEHGGNENSLKLANTLTVPSPRRRGPSHNTEDAQ
jgi:hypothetical protein